MAGEKKKKRGLGRKILEGEGFEAPTTGGGLKRLASKVSEHAEMKGIGFGGKIKEWKRPKGIPRPKINWKVGAFKGAGVREKMSTGRERRGRTPIAGFRFKVKF